MKTYEIRQHRQKDRQPDRRTDSQPNRHTDRQSNWDRKFHKFIISWFVNPYLTKMWLKHSAGTFSPPPRNTGDFLKKKIFSIPGGGLKVPARKPLLSKKSNITKTVTLCLLKFFLKKNIKIIRKSQKIWGTFGYFYYFLRAFQNRAGTFSPPPRCYRVKGQVKHTQINVDLLIHGQGTQSVSTTHATSTSLKPS